MIDWDYIRGTIGSAMAVILPLVKVLEPVLQFTGAIMGIILAYLSIRHKILQIKNEKKK